MLSPNEISNIYSITCFKTQQNIDKIAYSCFKKARQTGSKLVAIAMTGLRLNLLLNSRRCSTVVFNNCSELPYRFRVICTIKF